MPLSWRWALGLGLAFLSGLAAFEALFGGFTAVGLIVMLIVTLALALAAGFVLSSWGAGLALLIAAAAGGLVGSWVNVQASPTGTVEGLTGMGAVFVLFFWFAFFCLAPLVVILLTGVGIGKWRGMTLGKSHVRSVGDARVS